MDRNDQKKPMCRPPYCMCASFPGADWETEAHANGDFTVWFYCKKDVKNGKEEQGAAKEKQNTPSL